MDNRNNVFAVVSGPLSAFGIMSSAFSIDQFESYLSYELKFLHENLVIRLSSVLDVGDNFYILLFVIISALFQILSMFFAYKNADYKFDGVDGPGNRIAAAYIEYRIAQHIAVDNMRGGYKSAIEGLKLVVGQIKGMYLSYGAFGKFILFFISLFVFIIIIIMSALLVLFYIIAALYFLFQILVLILGVSIKYISSPIMLIFGSKYDRQVAINNLLFTFYSFSAAVSGSAVLRYAANKFDIL